MVAIGFDLDNTLYNRDENVRKLIKSYLQEKNLQIDTQSFLEIFNSESEIEYQKYIRGDKNRESYRIDRLTKTFSKFETNISIEDILEFNMEYESTQHSISLRPFVKEFIEAMLKLDHELFILTNGSSQDQLNKMNSLNLERYIPKEKWFISSELNMTKPSLEIFKYVENQLVSNEFVYIGDSYTNDIEPTQQLGWTSFYINSDIERQKKNSNLYYVNNFNEILNYY